MKFNRAETDAFAAAAAKAAQAIYRFKRQRKYGVPAGAPFTDQETQVMLDLFELKARAQRLCQPLP